MNKPERYARIDGLRAFSSVGIVLMHVLANTDYNLKGFVAEELIPSFTNLVFLFMMISSFSISCGYYESIAKGTVSLDHFYKKRFCKIWPFFAMLCVLELIYSPSIDALFELLANLTLCFGLIPDHGIEVVGVGWFLGVVFVFYFLFPFFCYLLSNKMRAWIAFGVSVLLNYVCTAYFDVDRTSIAHSAVFFMAGGMIYLYRELLSGFANKFSALLIAIVAILLYFYFAFGPKELIMLLLYTAVLIYALGKERRGFDMLANHVTRFLSRISMEVYLSHMFIFRVIEMCSGDVLARLPDTVEYVILAVGTMGSTIVFSIIMQKVFNLGSRYFMRLS